MSARGRPRGGQQSQTQRSSSNRHRGGSSVGTPTTNGTPLGSGGSVASGAVGGGGRGTPSGFPNPTGGVHQAQNAASNYYPCVMCSINVVDGDDALECDLCHNFVHQSCPRSTAENFSAAFYAIVGQEGEDSVAYFCPQCKGRKTDVFAVYREFGEYKTQMETKLKDMDDKIARMDSKLNEMTGRGAGGVNSTSSRKSIREALEREKKKNNAVIVGHPEVDKTKVRSDEDKRTVGEICSGIGVNPESVIDVFRDGQVRQDPDPANGKLFARIIKVKFDNYASKMAFLRGYRGQVGAGARSYVRHDQTHLERLQDRARQEQLREMRAKHPGEALFIFRGNICRRADRTVFVPGTA